jgi:ferric-dicitrate binding protein FerR (iron transport regulator)
MNPTTGGQLCARARFWASLRVDDELSELEGALLDAHLARCAECREFEAASAGSAALLRTAPLEAATPVVLPRDASRRGALLGTIGAAALVGAAMVAGLVQGGGAGGSAPAAVRSVAVVASVETPDQLRRLRRTSLLNERPLPRNISAEPF